MKISDTKFNALVQILLIILQRFCLPSRLHTCIHMDLKGIAKFDISIGMVEIH